jgi:hypothetical protein
MRCRKCEPNQPAVAAVHPLSACVRSRRVIVLAAAIVVLSFADLVITIAFLRAKWMMEANPIAVYIIETTQSAWALAAFKAVTVGICVALLLRLRRHVSGEIAAWCSVMILVVLSVMWHRYAKFLDDPHHMTLVQKSIDTGKNLALP